MHFLVTTLAKKKFYQFSNKWLHKKAHKENNIHTQITILKLWLWCVSQTNRTPTQILKFKPERVKKTVWGGLRKIDPFPSPPPNRRSWFFFDTLQTVKRPTKKESNLHNQYKGLKNWASDTLQGQNARTFEPHSTVWGRGGGSHFFVLPPLPSSPSRKTRFDGAHSDSPPPPKPKNRNTVLFGGNPTPPPPFPKPSFMNLNKPETESPEPPSIPTTNIQTKRESDHNQLQRHFQTQMCKLRKKWTNCCPLRIRTIESNQNKLSKEPRKNDFGRIKSREREKQKKDAQQIKPQLVTYPSAQWNKKRNQTTTVNNRKRKIRTPPKTTTSKKNNRSFKYGKERDLTFDVMQQNTRSPEIS